MLHIFVRHYPNDNADFGAPCHFNANLTVTNKNNKTIHRALTLMGNVNPFRRCFSTQQPDQGRQTFIPTKDATTDLASSPLNATQQNSAEVKSSIFAKIMPLKRSNTYQRLHIEPAPSMHLAQAWQEAKTIGYGDFSDIKKIGHATVSKSHPVNIMAFTLGNAIGLKLIEPIHHPYLVRPLGVARSTSLKESSLSHTGPHIFSAAEYAGTDVEQLSLRGRFALTQQRALQMALAVGALHAKSIVHRNIKPNSFLCAGDQSLIKLGDFGFTAKLTTPTETDITEIFEIANPLLENETLPETPQAPLLRAADRQNTPSREDTLKTIIAERLQPHTGVSAMDYTSPALVKRNTQATYKKSDDIFSLGVTLLETALAEIPTYFADYLLTDTDISEPENITRYVNTLQTERLAMISQASALAAKGLPHDLRNPAGQCLSKPFLDILHAMIQNPLQSDSLRVEDINFFIDKLAQLGPNDLFYPAPDAHNKKQQYLSSGSII